MKNLVLSLICALMLLPVSAMAMQAISDAELDGITGQAGVTVEFRTGDTTIETVFTNMSWGDDDGFDGGAVSDGCVRIDMITSAVGTDTFALNIIIPEGDTFIMDVDNLNGIVLQLPTNLSVTTVAPDGMRISIVDTQFADFTVAPTSTQTIGTLGLNGLAINITPSSILCIQPH